MKLPDTWTLIAICDGGVRWESVDGAILPVREARDLAERGDILMAQRRLAVNQMGLMIKRKAVRGRFNDSEA